MVTGETVYCRTVGSLEEKERATGLWQKIMNAAMHWVYISQKGERVTLLLTTPTSYSPLPPNLNSLSCFHCSFPHYFLKSYCICIQTNSFKRTNITKTVESLPLEIQNPLLCKSSHSSFPFNQLKRSKQRVCKHTHKPALPLYFHMTLTCMANSE